MCDEQDASLEVAPPSLRDDAPATPQRWVIAPDPTYDIMVVLDDWFDSSPLDGNELTWARVSKVAEEAGEAIDALALWRGANPRKGQTDQAREDLLKELADVAITGLCALQHLLKDKFAVQSVVQQRMLALRARMVESKEWSEA